MFAKEYVENCHADYRSVCRLSFRKSLEFALDRETNNIIRYLQFSEVDGEEYLTFLNELNNRIYIYDLDSVTNVATLPSTGEFDLKAQGFYYNGVDSVLIYNYALADFQLYVKDEKVADFVLSGRSSVIPVEYLPYPLASTGTPIYVKNSIIVATGCTADEFENEPERPVLVMFDMESGREKYAVSYPPCYQRLNWLGSLYYRQPYYTLVEQIAVISFPASHELYSYDFDDNTIGVHFAGSKEISKIYGYPISKKSFYNVSSAEEKEWYMANPSYEGIFYDKYREVYYRFARLPQPDFQKNNKGNRKPTVVIILDKNLQYIGETRLPDDVYFVPSNSFVSADGLNIQVRTDDEDQLLFYQYEVSKIR